MPLHVVCLLHKIIYIYIIFQFQWKNKIRYSKRSQHTEYDNGDIKALEFDSTVITLFYINIDAISTISHSEVLVKKGLR